MDECGSCGRTLASRWNYCIYCGKLMPKTAAVPSALPNEVDDELDDDALNDGLPHRARKFDVPFWLGVTMGVTGLAVIIFAAAEMISAYV